MAMTMNGEYELAVPPQTVWEKLNDAATLKACIPGCEQRAVIHVADAFAAADITLRFGGQEHLAHPRHRLRIGCCGIPW